MKKTIKELLLLIIMNGLLMENLSMENKNNLNINNIIELDLLNNQNQLFNVLNNLLKNKGINIPLNESDPEVIINNLINQLSKIVDDKLINKENIGLTTEQINILKNWFINEKTVKNLKNLLLNLIAKKNKISLINNQQHYINLEKKPIDKFKKDLKNNKNVDKEKILKELELYSWFTYS